jgi:hypothetical protein
MVAEIFRIQKRTREEGDVEEEEEDVEEKPKHNVIFNVEGSESSPSVAEVQG